MTRNKWLLIVGIVVLVCTGWAGRAEVRSPETERWEFMSRFGHAGQVTEFNALGSAGWELAAVTCNENQCTYFFKRRK